MTELGDIVRAAKDSGNSALLVQTIPYLNFIGFTLETTHGEMLGKMAYADPLIGNPSIPALHGGTIGALLESTAIFAALLETEALVLPKIVTITIDYLRSGRPVDTYAKASITRQGRRVVNVTAEAWQEDRARPIARANAIFLIEPL
ncbi:MAG TPA: PaaI family thioesterase [Polyangiaceae bacterium]|jgi:acyl-coenzyme A thioesterase PaaI-like protein|nr:PaaI family thioesterase [Polyangiaceae bacterium]